MADFDWGALGSFALGGPLGIGAYYAANGIKTLSDKGIIGNGLVGDFNNLSGLVDQYNSANASNKVAYTKTGVPYDRTNADSMINALATEYAYKRDDTAYDRLFDQLKRNGINPALLLSNSASPMSSEAPAKSGYSLSAKDQVTSALKAGSLLAIIIKLLSM